MAIYVGRRMAFQLQTIQEMTFIAWLNEDETYDIYKNRFDGTTPRGVSRSVILHYVINEGQII